MRGEAGRVGSVSWLPSHLTGLIDSRAHIHSPAFTMGAVILMYLDVTEALKVVAAFHFNTTLGVAIPERRALSSWRQSGALSRCGRIENKAACNWSAMTSGSLFAARVVPGPGRPRT